jgi:hypothetical protein
MRVGTFAGVGALAAALLLANSANAATFIGTSTEGATFTVTTVSNTEFLFDIKGISGFTGDWAASNGVNDLAAFAFTNILGTAGGESAQRIALTGSPPATIGSAIPGAPGGLSSGGCDSSGTGYFCFDIDPGIAIAGLDELKFDITVTGGGAFDYSTAPHLKIDWSGSSDSDTHIGDLYSHDLGVGTGVPEPATWAMMLVGAGLIGGALRMRRKTAIATA